MSAHARLRPRPTPSAALRPRRRLGPRLLPPTQAGRQGGGLLRLPGHRPGEAHGPRVGLYCGAGGRVRRGTGRSWSATKARRSLLPPGHRGAALPPLPPQASLASGVVDVVLIPEVRRRAVLCPAPLPCYLAAACPTAMHPFRKNNARRTTTNLSPQNQVHFTLEGPNGLLAYMEEILATKGHCVVCCAEGAGQARAGAGQAFIRGVRGGRRRLDARAFHSACSAC